MMSAGNVDVCIVLEWLRYEQDVRRFLGYF